MTGGTGAVDPPVARRQSSRWRSLLLAFAAYLALSVILWWNVWAAHPTSTATCGCGDSSLFIWFLEWPAYAVAHGFDPLYSTAMFHPGGINLLANTGVVAIGVPLAPVTWLFGSVASVNVASTLIPALSAAATYWLVRRWVSWAPAAVVAGLLYGFSPFVVTGLALGWLTPMLVVPPLIVDCLDELLVRQRRRPVMVGIVLGLLVVVQFFLGTELLSVMAITTLLGLAMMLAYAGLRDPADLRRRIPHAGAGLVTAALLAVVLLAYPVWFALAGPAHLTGRVWPDVAPGTYGLSLRDFWHLSLGNLSPAPRLFGGYQGPPMPQAAYLGGGLIVVVVVGTALWLNDRRLWLFGAVGVLSVALCLGVDRATNGFWVPWRVLARIPVIQNIVPERFVSMTFLCAAVMVGVIVDHARGTVTRWFVSVGRRELIRRSNARWQQCAAAVVALAIALVAVVPIATSYAGNIPLTMQPIVLPLWFSQVAPDLPGGQVVLTYPAAFSDVQSSITWQAVDRMHFAMPGGGGPQAVPSRAGAERAGLTVLADAAFSIGPLQPPGAAAIAAVRRALSGWGVTLVVVPDQPELPQYDQGSHTAYTVGLFTEALGRLPRYQARAWVWSGVPGPGQALAHITPAAFQACVGTADYRPGAPQTVPDCVLAASG